MYFLKTYDFHIIVHRDMLLYTTVYNACLYNWKKKKKLRDWGPTKTRKMCMQKKYIFKACKIGPYKKKCDMVHLLCIAYIKKNNEPKKED